MSLSLLPKVSSCREQHYMLVCSEFAPLMIEKCSWVRLDSISGLARGFCGALNRKEKKTGCKRRDRYRYGKTNSGAMFICIRILVPRTQPYSEKATSIIQAYCAFLKGVLLWTSSDTLQTIIILQWLSSSIYHHILGHFARRHLTIYNSSDYLLILKMSNNQIFYS